PAIGLPGDEYDSGYSDVITWIAQVAIPFGAYVVQNGNEGCILPTETGHVTGRSGGIALRDPTKASGTGYEVGDPVRVMHRGRAFVLNEKAVTYDDAVFVRYTAGQGEQLGALRDDDDTTPDASTPPGARWFKG